MAPVVFYDGHCPFCNFWVRTLLKYDRKKVFLFAPLSGKTATSYFNSKGIEIPDSIVFMENNTHLLASQAVFEIFKNLNGFFRLGLLFQWLPLRFTDLLYYRVANNRFVFGKPYKSCFSPKTEYKKRFLE